jgi:hypothetical protein
MGIALILTIMLVAKQLYSIEKYYHQNEIHCFSTNSNNASKRRDGLRRRRAGAAVPLSRAHSA